VAVAPALGILGGAFDPPHNGHLALARAATDRFRLGRLLVTVVAAPGHKGVVAGAPARLELACAAFGELPGAEVELDPHARTVDALAELRPENAIFLVGADELASFLDWKEPDRILDLVRLGVATRPGFPHERLDAVLQVLQRPDRVELFALAPLPISSSEIRDRVAAGEPIDELVPPRVAAEIARLGLYRAG